MSNSTLARRYLTVARPSARPCVVLEEVCHYRRVLHYGVSENSLYLLSLIIIYIFIENYISLFSLSVLTVTHLVLDLYNHIGL